MPSTIAHPPPLPHPRPEIWGGVECTVNRVRNGYLDQLEFSGHRERADDLERFAGLGIRTLRFPVLWESVAPESLDRPDWSWSDDRLSRLKSLGMTPIAGLVHHGSGPAYTSLVDPRFPEKLARYARMVAERYPWIEAYTPVNEPLTTARFSGLYGHWYPHGRDDRTFVRTLMNQCLGIAASMAAIRQVTPGARLVLTEDCGRTWSTPLLGDQAEFENHRRWLSFDLLFGRVGPGHPLYSRLLEWGADGEELERLRNNPCPPDIIGLNYYLTSDRFLDERLERYPSCSHGGNGLHRYADVEAVRGRPEGILGHRAALRTAWQRYGTPVAFTEVHLGCSREEQVRWFSEAWQAALDVTAEGIPVAGVTAWALLGSWEWNSLVTVRNNHYEPGVFDLRARKPRPTMLARAVRDLNRNGNFSHPVLESPGWWRRPERLFAPLRREKQHTEDTGDERQPPPLLILGATGTLGQALHRICSVRGLHHRLLSRRELDITSSASVAAALRSHRPWAIINAAGFVRVDEAEQDIRRCFLENTIGPVKLAAACRERGIRLVTFSSDLVFDGSKGDGYHEFDGVAPLNVYGRSKAEAERRVLAAMPDALVVRTSAFFGPWDNYNFITHTLRALSEGRKVKIADDLLVSPTYIPDLINACLDLLLDGESGIWHIANSGGTSWAELAFRAASLAGVNPSGVVPCAARELGYAARRPANSILASERHSMLPPLDDALGRYVSERGVTESLGH